MDNKKGKKIEGVKKKPSYSLMQSIHGKDTTSYEMVPGKTTMEQWGTKADGTPNMMPSTSYTKRKISNEEYRRRMKSPVPITGTVDPMTGMPMDPNRAGAPGRSINNLQAINTIQDPGMQSAQQAAAFQKFNNVAQYMPPPTMKQDETVSRQEDAPKEKPKPNPKPEKKPVRMGYVPSTPGVRFDAEPITE